MNKYIKYIFVVAVAVALFRLDYNKDVITGLVTGIPVGVLLAVLKLGGL